MYGILRKSMKDNNQTKPGTRMIHVRISKDLHKRLRICAAETETTIQDLVEVAITNELNIKGIQKIQSR